MWSALADAVLILHLLFIVFASLGGLLVLRWNWLAWLHLPMLGWAVWISFSNGLCPLTPLENHLRLRAGESAYDGGFIDQYIMPLVYPPGLNPTIRISLGAILLLGNLAIYGWLWRHRAGRPGGDG